MKKLKIAIIGLGEISEHHIQGYLNNKNTEIYAFCDMNAELLIKKGEKYGISRLYTDLATMFKELPEIDAVSVCTCNCAHASCSMMALNAGKDVLCEKPMAMNATEAKAMLETAKKNNKKLMVGFVRRFGNDTAVVKDFIQNGSLGDIYYAKATYLRRNGNPGGWFGDKKRSGGGPLIDLGVHIIDLTRYLMGNPKPISVYGVTFNKLGNRKGLKDDLISYVSEKKTDNDICDVEDFAVAFIRYDNGAVLSVETSFSLNIKSNVGVIELFGTNGGVKLAPEFELFTQINGYLADVKLNMDTRLSFNGLFQKEIDYFVDALLTDKDLTEIAEDGVILMEIIDAIYKSAENGREILLY